MTQEVREIAQHIITQINILNMYKDLPASFNHNKEIKNRVKIELKTAVETYVRILFSTKSLHEAAEEILGKEGLVELFLKIE